ncbi:hypothetical protein L6R46_12365 [Myxococcota bacterium]|nr:hypothetical protein [Myxococcota bacterium]
MNPYAPPRAAEPEEGQAERSSQPASILLRLAARGVDLTQGFFVAAPLALLFSLSDELPLEQVVARTILGGLALCPLTSVVMIGLRGVLARESLLLVMLCAGCCAPPLFVLLIGVMSWTGRRAPHDWMTEAVVLRHGGR